MNSRERVESVINFRKADRVPFNFWMDRKRMAELDAKFGDDFRVAHYDADIVESFLLLDYPHGRFEENANTQWLTEPFFTNYDQLDRITMPNPDDPKIYELIRNDIQRYPDKAIICDLPNVLTISETIRSQIDLYMDLMTRPEDVSRLFSRLSDRSRY